MILCIRVTTVVRQDRRSDGRNIDSAAIIPAIGLSACTVCPPARMKAQMLASAAATFAASQSAGHRVSAMAKSILCSIFSASSSSALTRLRNSTTLESDLPRRNCRADLSGMTTALCHGATASPIETISSIDRATLRCQPSQAQNRRMLTSA
jgi:hypothetical protein